MKHHEQQPAHNSSLCQDHPSEDSENAAPGLKKQKSRREISREAKLVRKVNTLEEKLDRARRELRELSGNEGKLLAPVPEPTCMSIEMDPGNYPRKFVPGALPTLPSERLLDQQTILPASPTADANQATVPSTVEDQRVPKDEYRQVTIDSAKSPKRRSKDPRPSSMGKESSSLKRKSPVPEHIASGIPVQPNQTDRLDKLTSESDHIVDTDLLTTPRQSKWQKFEAGDSPGSVGRSHIRDRQGSPTKSQSKIQSSSPHNQSQTPSAGIDDSLDVKTIQSSSALRTQRRRSNLRPDSLAHVDSGPDLASGLSIDFELSPPLSLVTRTSHSIFNLIVISTLIVPLAPLRLSPDQVLIGGAAAIPTFPCPASTQRTALECCQSYQVALEENPFSARLCIECTIFAASEDSEPTADRGRISLLDR
ncbi:hypothetical protein N7470_004032 [Penicillium chermesinum]|nr:hypothetical protein N7470_004032 [Penicillium chermesinum]